VKVGVLQKDASPVRKQKGPGDPSMACSEKSVLGAK
jgi:hypothetical protein